jgi:hypothetical protein
MAKKPTPPPSPKPIPGRNGKGSGVDQQGNPKPGENNGKK